jgi:hypothetical protein
MKPDIPQQQIAILEYAIQNMTESEKQNLPDHLFRDLSNEITIQRETYIVHPLPIRIAKRFDEILEGFKISDPQDLIETLKTLVTIIAREHAWGLILQLLENDGLASVDLENIVATQSFVNGPNDPYMASIRRFLNELRARYCTSIYVERKADQIIFDAINLGIEQTKDTNND